MDREGKPTEPHSAGRAESCQLSRASLIPLACASWSPSLPGLASPSATTLRISGNLAVLWEKKILMTGED